MGPLFPKLDAQSWILETFDFIWEALQVTVPSHKVFDIFRLLFICYYLLK